MIKGFLSGRSDEVPAPYVRALVYLPRFRISRMAERLIDTGAEATCLHPRDSLLLLGPPEWHQMTSRTNIEGIGGEASYYREVALLGFIHEDGRPDLRPVELFIAEPGHRNISLPSVLGRDILLRLGLVLDIHRQEVRLAE